MSIKSPRLRRKSRAKSPKRKINKKQYFDVINRSNRDGNIIYLIRTHKNDEIWVSEENLKKLGRHFGMSLKKMHNLQEKLIEENIHIEDIFSNLISKIL